MKNVSGFSRRIIIIFHIVATFLFQSGEVKAQKSLGFQIGLVNSDFIARGSAGHGAGSALGMCAGTSLEIPISGRLGLKFGANYARLGYHYMDWKVESVQYFEVKRHQIDFPVTVQVKIGKQFSVAIGGYYSINGLSKINGFENTYGVINSSREFSVSSSSHKLNESGICGSFELCNIKGFGIFVRHELGLSVLRSSPFVSGTYSATSVGIVYHFIRSGD